MGKADDRSAVELSKQGAKLPLRDVRFLRAWKMVPIASLLAARSQDTLLVLACNEVWWKQASEKHAFSSRRDHAKGREKTESENSAKPSGRQKIGH